VKQVQVIVRAVTLVAAPALSLGFLLLFLGLTSTVQAQPAVYCPIQITKGDVWIDTFPLVVRNIGNGVALGIQITNSYPVISQPGPWGGGGGVAIMTNNFQFVDRLGPGMEEKIMVRQEYRTDSWAAKVEACVPQ